MKLIRLTSDSNDGRFDNSFNDEIIIEPKSKIALQSLAVRSDIGSLTIDDDNHDIQFEVVSGNTRTVTLDNFTYDENDNHKFLNDLQLKLNQGLQYTDGQSATKFKNELGFQFKVGVADAGQAEVQMANTRYAYSSPADIKEVFGNTDEVNFAGTNPVNIASATTGANSGRADEKHTMYSVKPFTTGCGVFRLKYSTYTASTESQLLSGFEFGLCDSKPDTWTLPSMPDSKKTYALRGFQPTANYSVKKGDDTDFALATNQDGDNVNPSLDGGGNVIVDATADILEISIQGANIVCTVFKSDETVGNILFTEPYEVDSNGIPVPLFGYLTFHGSRGNIEFTDMKFTPDAYLEPRPNTLGDPVESFGSGARPTQSFSNSTIKKIDFGSESVASFLGFNNIINIATAGKNKIFIGNNLFTALIENECYIILLENIQLESYDGLKQGRKSILASIPNPTNGDRVIYEPNTNNYIELNNANPISLRNIRARIFYQDYTPVKTLGLSVLSLLVANQTE